MHQYDVIVIGGGHAGAEAASASARMGARTLLLTQRIETIGQMSCNPAIGGIAKGTVVREVDALGGIMGRATDLSRIQFRMLNRSKGPAVASPRAQCDRKLYRQAVRSLLERQRGLQILEATVADFVWERHCVAGVKTVTGQRFLSPSVVITAGTFLRGSIHVGSEAPVPAGRAGDAPCVAMAEAVARTGLKVERFKTGTPPRIDGRTIDRSRMQRQDGDLDPYWFSCHARPQHPEQVPCWLTWSDARLKEIIERHLHESAMYGGAISGRGPRYCPSVEDKVVRFPHAERHQVFLEPEGLDTTEMYVNGLSTSLPAPVQLEFLRSVPGLEAVEMTRPGYAIEYDYFPPTQLSPTLAVRSVPGLFFAGQINGTTGYEEAAGQGVVAGVNAAAAALGRDPLVLRRNEAYIGVMVDDLVSRGVDEPYRLFTSRSEYRLLMRQDNALRRLLPAARSYGLLSEQALAQAEQRIANEERVATVSRETVIAPDAANPVLAVAGSRMVTGPVRVAELAKRPEVDLPSLLRAVNIEITDDEAEWAGIELKYEGYLAREQAAAAKLARMNDFVLSVDLPYRKLATISTEARQKLSAARPANLGQASRIPGVSPSDLQSLVMEVMKGFT